MNERNGVRHRFVDAGIPIIGADLELQARLHMKRKSRRLSAQLPCPRQGAEQDSEASGKKDPWYDLSAPALAYPVRANGHIEPVAGWAAVTERIRPSGLKLLTETFSLNLRSEWLIGIQLATDHWQFTGGQVIDFHARSASLTEVHVRLGGKLDLWFEQGTVLPRLNQKLMRLELPGVELICDSLLQIGAIEPVTLDRVMVCPRCQSLPTIRNGCCDCLSGNLQATRMIHHFPCAHVDFVENFETADGLACQKCRTRQLVVGSDYEYLHGPYVCQDCNRSQLAPGQVGHCLNCEHRFPWESATEMEVTGYHVNRLDPLAIIDSV